ncbi:MAG: IS481 family transposase [Tepidiformaceae bacterium]
MSHRNAKLTESGRMLLIVRLQEGWTQAQVAAAQGVSRSTVAKWWKRYREEGIAGLQERSSRAIRLPHALGETVIEAICSLRRELGAGPHRIAYELKLAPSTVYGVLRRAGLSVLARLDRSTRAVIRYERDHPGALVHLDVKRLGRIPEGGGKRFDVGFAETGAGKHRPGPKRGHDYIHVAVDDHSRFVYAESLPDEKAATTAAFLERMVFALAQRGIAVERVLTDNARCYYSGLFVNVASHYGIQLRKTRPFRPQTNGKAEAFIKTLQREWAYRRPYTSNEQRLEALETFLVDYNFARPHTAIGNLPPASRL